jgi:hypothetical protein
MKRTKRLNGHPRSVIHTRAVRFAAMRWEYIRPAAAVGGRPAHPRNADFTSTTVEVSCRKRPAPPYCALPEDSEQVRYLRLTDRISLSLFAAAAEMRFSGWERIGCAGVAAHTAHHNGITMATPWGLCRGRFEIQSMADIKKSGVRVTRASLLR